MKIFVFVKERHALARSHGERDSPLNTLDGDFDLALLRLGFLLAVVAAPSPLDLDGGNVVHGKAMVLEEPPRQRHLKSRLDQGCAVVFEALIFVFVEYVKWRGEELLPQSLCCGVVHLHL